VYDKYAKYWDEQGLPEVANTLRFDENNRKSFGDPNWTIGGQPQPSPSQFACPFCDYTAPDKPALKEHVFEVHLQPCKLRDWLRKLLGYPIEKLK